MEYADRVTPGTGGIAVGHSGPLEDGKHRDVASDKELPG
jgi:hypothetical protein